MQDAFATEGDSDNAPIQTTTLSPTVTSSESIMSTWSGRCEVLSSDWTPCSRSCDVGTSIRLTNDNQECRVETQVRLCLVRPCDVRFPDVRSDFLTVATIAIYIKQQLKWPYILYI